MSEATGLEARTIHRRLEVDHPRTGGFRSDADNPLDCGLLVVDEASMVDVPPIRVGAKTTSRFLYIGSMV